MQNNIEDIMKEYIRAAKLIKDADALIFLAGAGMGVDAGLPDFRGKEGFWKAYPPMAKLGLEFSQMSTPKWFKEDPEFAWGFWSHRYNLYREKKPHEGYQILKCLSEDKDYFIFTSNVDSHFEQVFPKEKIIECHGNITYWQCSDVTCTQPVYENKDAILECDEKTFRNKNPPKCPKCGHVARPNVLMFGDWDWLETREAEQNKRYKDWISKHRNYSICCIEIGAGTAIPTVRYESETWAIKSKNGSLIRINIRDPEVGPNVENFVSLPIGGLEALSQIERAYKEEIKKDK